MDTGGGAFALKFISGKYQGGEFPLAPGKEVVIGRSAELELVLVEEMVSRRHARLYVDGDGTLTITDLGSTNGTFVNGEKVSETELKVGDRFLIGTSIFKVITLQAGAVPLDEKEIRHRLEKVAAAKPKTGGAMSGRIDEVSIPDLLQLFQASKKSGVLILNDEVRDARIYLRKGRITFAEIEGEESLGPLKAIYRLIGWDAGTFELAPPEDRTFDEELQESTEAILMEGTQHQDEMRRLEADLPPRGARIDLAHPMEPRLGELAPEELDVLQLVHNHGELGAVLDNSPASDLDTGRAVVALLERGYVRSL